MAKKQLLKLDRSVAKSITTYLRERVLPLEDPKTFGTPLTKHVKKNWCYRVGDCSVIYDLDGELLTIMVVRVGKRKGVYKKNTS